MRVNLRVTSVVALALVVVAPPLFAQVPFEPVRPDPVTERWRWRVFPAFSALGVRVIHPSRTGSLWLGSADGVVGFDGTVFTPLGGSGAPEGPINHVLETRTGHVLAAKSRAIHRWDGSTWIREGPEGEPPGFVVRGFAEDVAGRVWAATSWGLLRLGASPELLTTSGMVDTLALVAPELNPRAVPVGVTEPGGTLTPGDPDSMWTSPELVRVHASADGLLWLARAGGEILRFDPDGDPVDPASWTRFGREDGLDIGALPRIGSAPDGTVWTVSGSGLGGVNRFEGGRWTSFRLSSIGGSDINPSVLVTRDGAVWVAGPTSLHVLRDGEWRVVTLSDAPVPGGNLRLEEDLAGRVWIFGSGGQTTMVDQGPDRWRSLEGLSLQSSSPDGTVRWYLDDAGRVVREEPGGVWRSYGPEHGLMDAPTVVVLDGSGMPWAAGGHGGVAATARLEGDGEWTRTLHPELSWSVDYRAAFLAPDGVLWFGGAVDVVRAEGQLGGVLSFDGSWTHHRPPAAPESAYGIGATADGRVWVGGLDGLSVYDGQAWSPVVEPEALSASPLDAVHGAGDGALWIGSRADGLFRYADGEWTTFDVTDGLPANGIVDVWSDADGTWAFTVAGLARFDGVSWRSHGLGEGLTMARRGRLRRGADGVLWVTTFQPSTTGLTLNRVESPYRSWSIGVARDTLAPTTTLAAVPKRISRPGNLSLAWTGTDPWNVTAADDLEYSVRVDSGAWSPYARETSRFVDALPPGTHEISVRARDADGNVELAPAAASVLVEPPVWQMLWFQMLVGSLVLVGLWQSYRVFVRDQRLQAANAQLEDRVQQRTRELETAYQDLRRSVADRQEVERRLRQSQKMDALGRLAGGLAHDFNNLLTVISANTSLTLLDAKEEQREELEAVLLATNQAVALTARLLALGRQQELEPVPLDLSAAVRDMRPLFKPLTKGGVELKLDLPDGLPPVLHDPSQFNQVVLNIVLNAVDAMPGGGELSIRTELVELDTGYAQVHVDVVPGWYVLLAISDTGHGMDATTLDRIFEPFFTSKETGTGLGLATVYGIVRQSGGHVSAYSEPGAGTTFKLFFPTAQPSGPATDDTDLNGLRGTERVLVVEDDDVMRALIGRALRYFGYSVLEAASAEAARALAAQEATGSLDALVADIFLGDATGFDVAAAVAELHPDVRTLFISGYDQYELAKQGDRDGSAFLSKPFTQVALARALRAQLDGS